MTTKLVQEDFDKLGKYTLEDLKDIVGETVPFDEAAKAADKISDAFEGSTNGLVLAGAIIVIMRILALAKELQKTDKALEGRAPN